MIRHRTGIEDATLLNYDTCPIYSFRDNLPDWGTYFQIKNQIYLNNYQYK